VHISELAHGRTDKTEDVVKKGDRVRVKLIDRDERGRLRLSMKALVPKPEGTPEDSNGSRGPRREESGAVAVASGVAPGESTDAPSSGGEDRGRRGGGSGRGGLSRR